MGSKQQEKSNKSPCFPGTFCLIYNHEKLKERSDRLADDTKEQGFLGGGCCFFFVLNERHTLWIKGRREIEILTEKQTERRINKYKYRAERLTVFIISLSVKLQFDLL